MQDLRKQATKGIFWSFVDQFASQGIGFVIGVILARKLLPSDYGLIGMLGIFIAVANSFINSGFGSALTQKKNRTEKDFSTVFVFNLAVSLFFYFLLFFTAPFIADFYDLPQLMTITRVCSINFVINALMIVPKTKLTINLNFKLQTNISIASGVFSGIVGVWMAYSGFGVWSLVIQGLVNVIVQAILFFYLVKWRPSFIFSKDSFRELFGFGSKMLISGLLDTVYNNVYSLVIGKKFSAADLGFYSRAQQLESLPAQNITAILQRVTFPIFCSIQDDDNRLITAYRKLIRMAAFIIFPTMFVLVLVAKPLVVLLLTDKWLPTVSLFQILCFSGMWYPIHAINLNILQAKGRSDLFLKLEVWKKVMVVLVLLITLPMGLNVMVMGQVFSSFVALFINTYYTGKYFSYGILSQLKDVFIFLIISLVICAVLLYFISFLNSDWLKLIVGMVAFLISYVFLARIFNFEELKVIMNLIKNRSANF